MYFSNFCTAVVNGIMYIVTDRNQITRLGSCGFESVVDLPSELDLPSAHPVCAPTPGPESKLLMCFGLNCATFDTESQAVQVTASLNDYHYEGKMLLDPISNENIVIGGTSSTSSPFRGERLINDNGSFSWVEYLDLTKTLPLNYRRFSTAIGPDDTGTFFFSGFGVNDDGTYFPDTQFNLVSQSNGLSQTVENIDTTDFLYPVSDLGMDSIFQPKTFNSIGGNGFILHHRRHECTNEAMR